MTLSDLLAIIGALGGFELIKFFANRKSDRRINNAHASTEEFAALKAQNEYLTKMLNEWIERYDDQTKRLRTTQDSLFECERRCAQKEQRIADLEQRIVYLKFWRCEDSGCATRKPPGRLLQGLTYDSQGSQLPAGGEDSDTTNSSKSLKPTNNEDPN
jgi:hypothetical protein